MKSWLFALIELAIAALAVGAFLLGQTEVLIAGSVVLFIVHFTVTRRKRRKGNAEKANLSTEPCVPSAERLQRLREEPVELPLPHRAIVAAMLTQRHEATAEQLLAQYDRLTKAIKEKSFAAEELAAAWADKVSPWVVATYLQGLAARESGDLFAAKRMFWKATRQKPTWVSPWLGWATSAYQLRDFNEIEEHHPRITRMEQLPMDCGDEESLRTLKPADQQDVAELFRSSSLLLSDLLDLAEADAANVDQQDFTGKARTAA